MYLSCRYKNLVVVKDLIMCIYLIYFFDLGNESVLLMVKMQCLWDVAIKINSSIEITNVLVANLNSSLTCVCTPSNID